MGGYSRTRVLAILAAGVVLCIPLFVFAPNTERVANRAESLTNLDDDNSMQARMHLYEQGTLNAVLNPLGIGIGSLGTAARLQAGGDELTSGALVFDSGVLAIPLTLGWPGTTLYLGGLIWMLLMALRITPSNADQFAVIGVAIVIAFMAMMVFSNQLKGVSGMMVWSFLGLALASKHYHQTRAAVPVESQNMNRRS